MLNSKMCPRGQNAAAITLLENNTNKFTDRELIYMELIRAHREAEIMTARDDTLSFEI